MIITICVRCYFTLPICMYKNSVSLTATVCYYPRIQSMADHGEGFIAHLEWLMYSKHQAKNTRTISGLYYLFIAKQQRQNITDSVAFCQPFLWTMGIKLIILIETALCIHIAVITAVFVIGL